MPVRLIDANALHAKILEENRRNYAATENVAQILLRIETAPTIVPEVRRGRWECGGFCSECGLDNEERKTPFCPNCGADMRKEGADNEHQV